MTLNSGLHHFHRRKRIYKKHEPYPSRDKWKNLMDRLIYAVAIIGPLFAMPQVLTIWVDQNASGVSVATWSLFILTSGFWLIYGLLHKEKPIIVTQILWLMIQSIIVAGVLVYG